MRRRIAVWLLAVVKAPYRMSFDDAKGKKTEDHDTSMTVFKKVNGQWKILYDTNISEVAPQSLVG